MFKRKTEGRGFRVTRLGAAAVLVLGLLTGLVAALVSPTVNAYAGSVTVNYTCPSPVGNETVPLTVSETPDITGNVQLGTTLTEDVTVSATIPGSLLDLAAGSVTSLPLSSASITINGVNVGSASQTTSASAAAGLPISIPVGAAPNPPYSLNLPMDPLTWTAGPSTGPASLTPGAFNMNVGLALACTPAAGTPAMDSFTVTSPPTPPVVVNQTASVSSGQSTTINVLSGATDIGDTIVPSTVAVTGGPSNGTAVAQSDGTVVYTNNGSAATSDTFTFTVKNTTGQTSNTGTVTVNISFNTCSAGAGNPGGGSTGSLGQCSLSQLILLPVEPGQIVLSQSGGLPLDVLGSSFCTGGTTPGIVLNGDAQNACGVLSPLTITNATGLDTGWTLQGQVTDFVDPATAGNTCDTVATYNNHCIPGDNLAWQPASAVAHTIVPGDTAQVTSGAVVNPVSPLVPVHNPNPVLQGALSQSNPVVELPVGAGLHSAPATLCSTAAGQAGGTFVCGAGLELAVPASIAEPTVDSHIGAPAYEATITLTLF